MFPSVDQRPLFLLPQLLPSEPFASADTLATLAGPVALLEAAAESIIAELAPHFSVSTWADVNVRVRVQCLCRLACSRSVIVVNGCEFYLSFGTQLQLLCRDVQDVSALSEDAEQLSSGDSWHQVCPTPHQNYHHTLTLPSHSPLSCTCTHAPAPTHDASFASCPSRL